MEAGNLSCRTSRERSGRLASGPASRTFSWWYCVWITFSCCWEMHTKEHITSWSYVLHVDHIQLLLGNAHQRTHYQLVLRTACGSHSVAVGECTPKNMIPAASALGQVAACECTPNNMLSAGVSISHQITCYQLVLALYTK